MKTSSKLNKLMCSMNEEDLISALLYAIYKGTQNPKYSTLSQLIYILNKKDMFKLCETLGGCTIQIPTVSQLKTFSNALLLKQLVEVEGLSLEKALEQVDVTDLKSLLMAYEHIGEALNEFEGHN